MLTEGHRRGHVGQLLASQLFLDPPELVERPVQIRKRLSGARQVFELAALSRLADLPVDPALPADAWRLALSHRFQLRPRGLVVLRPRRSSPRWPAHRGRFPAPRDYWLPPAAPGLARSARAPPGHGSWCTRRTKAPARRLRTPGTCRIPPGRFRASPASPDAAATPVV